MFGQRERGAGAAPGCGWAGHAPHLSVGVIRCANVTNRWLFYCLNELLLLLKPPLISPWDPAVGISGNLPHTQCCEPLGTVISVTAVNLVLSII